MRLLAMNNVSILAALTAATLACGAVQAQPAVKPGLWQVQTRMPSDPEFDKAMAELGADLAAMSPAERKQMEAAMGKQGIQLAAGGKGGTASRFCMSREQAERREVTGTQGDCTLTRQSRSGATFTSAFTCVNPRSSGETVVTFAGPEAYSSRLTMVSEQGGKKDKTVIESEAKWLSADCGNLKPLGVKAK
jgi:hypothetical protein